ncbi:MAG TPA: flagellin [Methanoregula sp.]|nr:flagellin [Methanoregula sp.]
MSAETFTTAMFLITAIIAAGVLVNAVFPIVYTMAGTFSSASHESDERIRTDFRIITTFAVAGSPGYATIWMKNVGSARISLPQIERSDVFCGAVGDFDRLTNIPSGNPGDGQWIAVFDSQYDLNNNGYWDPGETVKIVAVTQTIPSSGNMVYYQFALPNGIWRSTEFMVR